MTASIETRSQIAELVRRYQSLTQASLREYNEENNKKDYVLPLYEALGWKVDDAAEVAAEHATGRGRVDYTFRIGGVSRFYLEAKPLRDDLAVHNEWVTQAISYAYNRGIPWVVLTNFKDLWLFTGDAQPQRFITLSATQFVTDLNKLILLSRDSMVEVLL